MRVALDTLGCKLNQAETELLAREITAAGHSLVDSIDEADLYIVNTCTVTQNADSKSRHHLRMARRRNPRAIVAATGCYVRRAPGELSVIEGINLIADDSQMQSLFQLLLASDSIVEHAESGNGTNNVSRTRAFIKIQDGCSKFCTYCIVPMVRGREKSVPADQVIDEVRRRLADGYKEIVLTGTEVGSYQDDGSDLKRLLGSILKETEVVRVRLSSLQPQEISAGLLELWQDGRLCPHFHLSLQSGSDTVLKRMNRRYSLGEYRETVSILRSAIPDVAVTTDIIVGFPGETDEEFDESYATCRELGFARIHVFPFSLRPGTAASLMPGKLDARTVNERRKKMLALAKESEQRFRQQFRGRIMPVLWEAKLKDGTWSGLTGNYIRVRTKSGEDLTNRLLTAEIR